MISIDKHIAIKDEKALWPLSAFSKSSFLLLFFLKFFDYENLTCSSSSDSYGGTFWLDYGGTFWLDYFPSDNEEIRVDFVIFFNFFFYTGWFYSINLTILGSGSLDNSEMLFKTRLMKPIRSFTSSSHYFLSKKEISSTCFARN